MNKAFIDAVDKLEKEKDVPKEVIFDAEHFYGMVMNAASDSKKRVQILEKRGAAPDHPVLLGYPKSEYLKCAICRVM